MEMKRVLINLVKTIVAVAAIVGAYKFGEVIVDQCIRKQCCYGRRVMQRE